MDTADASGSELPSLVDRVNLAFAALHPRDRGPYTTGEVVQWLSHRTASEFFGAPAEYFVNDDHTARAVHRDLRHLVAARTLIAWLQP